MIGSGQQRPRARRRPDRPRRGRRAARRQPRPSGSGGSPAAPWWSRWSRARCVPARRCSSRVERVSSAAYDEKAGAVGSLWDVVRDRRLNHRPEVIGGVLAEESTALLEAFFARHRDFGAHRRRPVAFPAVACPSGLRRTPRKRLLAQANRGFKSLRHRQPEAVSCRHRQQPGPVRGPAVVNSPGAPPKVGRAGPSRFRRSFGPFLEVAPALWVRVLHDDRGDRKRAGHRPGRRGRRPDGRAHPGARQAGAPLRGHLPAARLPALQLGELAHRRCVALGAVPGLGARGPGPQRPPLGPRPRPGRAAAADPQQAQAAPVVEVRGPGPRARSLGSCTREPARRRCASFLVGEREVEQLVVLPAKGRAGLAPLRSGASVRPPAPRAWTMASTFPVSTVVMGAPVALVQPRGMAPQRSANRRLTSHLWWQRRGLSAQQPDPEQDPAVVDALPGHFIGWRWRRDLNPRLICATNAFEAFSLGRSDTPPRRGYQTGRWRRNRTSGQRAKNSRRRRASSASTPAMTSGRWFSRGPVRRPRASPTAPAFSSYAANTTRSTREGTTTRAHRARLQRHDQGVPAEPPLPVQTAAVSRIATTSAWAVSRSPRGRVCPAPITSPAG